MTATVDDAEIETAKIPSKSESDGKNQVNTDFSSPYWLSAEEIEAKGVPHHEVEQYRRFVYKQAFGLDTWYNGSLKEHTFETQFVELSETEIDAMVRGSQFLDIEKPLSSDQQLALDELEKRLDGAVETFGEAGAFVKLSTRSPKDAIFYRNDVDFVTEIRLAVINELEIEGQMAQASFQRTHSFRKSGKIELKGDEKPKSEEDNNSIPKALLRQKSENEAFDVNVVHKEPLKNAALRAFTRVMSTKNQVRNGKEAMYLLRHSLRIKEDLQQLHTWNKIAGLKVNISVRKWDPTVARHPGMEFRGFVYNNQLNAVSQYDDVLYYPNVVQYREVICTRIKAFFEQHVKEALQEHKNYVVDFFVGPEKVYLIEINPFHNGAGACLFTWREHREVFMNGPFEFRVVESPQDDCLTALHATWQKQLETIIMQKTQPPRRRSFCHVL